MDGSVNHYTKIENVSKTLVNLLWNSIKDDPRVNAIITNEKQISLSSPKKFDSKTSTKISILLYNISKFPNMKNTPVNNPNEPSSSMYLTLHYLITPHTRSPERDHILLGKIIQIFTDNLLLQGNILLGNRDNEDTELKVMMDPLSINDLNKLWMMLKTQYKLSLSYTVSPVKIESTHSTK